jgi:3-dehydroquinate synthase
MKRTTTMTTRITLPHYAIVVGHIWDDLRTFLHDRSYSQLIVLTDDNTKQHCWPILQKELDQWPLAPINITPGEQHKTIPTCQHIWSAMFDLKVDRNALFINLGGGVIGDMGGFCASTYKRGIDFIQIPTTLLSQVDASIGGKLGIDFMQVKNSVGLFRDPQAVFIAPQFLKTLSQREVRSGFAEIIKHSLIADARQWEQIQAITTLQPVDWSDIIPQSLMIKKDIVEADPFEKGLRKALNFGHTVGHAIESHALESAQPLLHGEAIAVGMICESYLSRLYLSLSEKDLEAIADYIYRLYQPRAVDTKDYDTYLALMANDKKNEGKAINFTLLQAPGKAEVNQTCTEKEIRDSLDFFNTICNR